MTRNTLTTRYGVLVLALMATSVAWAQTPVQRPSEPSPTKSEPVTDSRYCRNVVDAAADARYLLQKEALSKAETEVEGRVKALEAKRAELEVWIKRRQEVLDLADEAVTKIYSGMRPDAAAVQIASMDDDVAAGILVKLKSRTASAIFNEMEPARAAKLANTISDAPKRTPANRENQ
jgi:flagellar motility protein MotE (MotC chaperone)